MWGTLDMLAARHQPVLLAGSASARHATESVACSAVSRPHKLGLAAVIITCEDSKTTVLAPLDLQPQALAVVNPRPLHSCGGAWPVCKQ